MTTPDGQWRVDLLVIDDQIRYRLWRYGTLVRPRPFRSITEVQDVMGDAFTNLREERVSDA